MTPPEVVFALAWGQNVFFAEFAEALVEELGRLGAPARIAVGGFPEHRKGVVTVLLPPHEFVALTNLKIPRRVLRRCLLISAEQPESVFFAGNVALAEHAGGVLDINPRAVRAYQAAGIAAEHLQLGYSPAWDRGRPQDERDVDILFLGRASARRELALSRYAGSLERFNCRVILSDDSQPNVTAGVNFVTGETKLKLFGRTKVLLNVHGEDEPYFEWLRMVEAMSSGVAVVSEHSTDLAPLAPGADLLAGRFDALGLLAAYLAEDDAARQEIVGAADAKLRNEIPLSAAAERLLAAAERVDAGGTDTTSFVSARLLSAQLKVPAVPPPPPPPLPDPVSLGEHRMLRAMKREHLEMVSLRRQLARRALESERPLRPAPELLDLGASPAGRLASEPKVSVVVPMFNDSDVITEALDSVARSTFGSWEVVVVDDASTDRGPEVVREWIAENPRLRVRIVGHELNAGLSRARNTGTAAARGELLLMLDSDNEIRPWGLARLVRALRADPAAVFAYGLLEKFSHDEAVGLVSRFGWEPARLRVGNYIDALALIRKGALEAAGGYSEDSRLALGLEDYDLWCRFAEAGQRGAYVRNFVGRYRAGHSSMVSVTSISFTDARAAIAEHAPNLMRGVPIS